VYLITNNRAAGLLLFDGFLGAISYNDMHMVQQKIIGFIVSCFTDEDWIIDRSLTMLIEPI